jgi:A/G-specific adenine glycosylase
VLLKISPPRRWRRCWSSGPGSGYYARARNLHACARAVVISASADASPATAAELMQLPGVGPLPAPPSPPLPPTQARRGGRRQCRSGAGRYLAIEVPVREAK